MGTYGGTAWEVQAGDGLAGQMPGYSAVNLGLCRRLPGPPVRPKRRKISEPGVLGLG